MKKILFHTLKGNKKEAMKSFSQLNKVEESDILMDLGNGNYLLNGKKISEEEFKEANSLMKEAYIITFDM